ncbi:MAG: 4-methyl-5(b-hydroxyethyl)-thiazole monophosphate biosynthesi [Candidatus Saganbacteria bacterium]|uniref:4-methyl-5(B-hydroxyethyl)-thiazole monophosphate biosynthesi n=1 Tax=Candidatus Saganbacteria bacterium TaxID=2575572 RepID=A0A833L2U9_UNCSA|nr:MAG: 4-methyl-5(b-hydroxyethyl)-thiazole monophosphate biosynthesi [Candidatus Saganbacteria bacterium]
MKKVLLLFLSQGFEEAEASAFIDVCGWSRIVKDVQPVELLTVGLHNEIKAAHNLIVKPQKLLKEINPSNFDAFALPGGFHARGFEEAYKDEVLEVRYKKMV